MSLGKTVQALTHLAIEKASGRMDCPAPVVAPARMLPNWRREVERFTPDLKVLVVHGLGRRSRFGKIATHDLVLTTYALLARDDAVLKAPPWHVIVLDEPQVIRIRTPRRRSWSSIWQPSPGSQHACRSLSSASSPQSYGLKW
jgi:SNF2 family DNA or RNA helicase